MTLAQKLIGEADGKRVVNLLKSMINQCFQDEVYKDIGEMPSLLDMSIAITFLESAKIQPMKIVDDREFLNLMKGESNDTESKSDWDDNITE